MRKLYVLLAVTIAFFSTSHTAFANYVGDNESEKEIGTGAGFGTTKNFQVICNPVATFTEDFNSVATPNLPNCWQRIGSGGSVSTQAADANSLPNALYMSSPDESSRAIVALPEVTNLTANTHRLRFSMRAEATVGGRVEIGYLTNSSNPSTFQLIATFTASSLTYQTFTVAPSISNNAARVLVFRHAGNPTYGVLIDDVVWELAPTCFPPTAITVSAITSIGASIAWIPPTIVPATYQVYINTTGTAPTSATPPTATGLVLPSYAAGGLLANTTYYVWIRSSCGTGFSDWSAVQTFTTLCSPSSIPYSLNFDAVTPPAVPACVTKQDVNGDGNTWNVVGSKPGYNGNLMSYYVDPSGQNAANDWFFTNSLNLTAGKSYIISYKFSNNIITYTERMKVAYGTAASATGMTTVIADYPALKAPIPRVHSIRFTPPATGVYYIGFHAYSEASQWELYVDEISVTEAAVAQTPANTCVPVSEVRIDDQANNKWLALIDGGGNIIGEINGNGNDLGIVTAKVYRNTGQLRSDAANRYYLDRNVEITPGRQPIGPVSVRLFFTAAELAALQAQAGSNVSSYADISVFKNNDPCGSRLIGGATKLSTTQATYGTDYVVTFDVSSFSSFYLAASTYSTLPANILTFSGSRQGTVNLLRWSVAQESNVLEYDVERSENGGRAWIKVGSVASLGNTTSNRSYGFTDKTITGLKQLYRLRQVDRNGLAKLSAVVSVTAAKPTRLTVSSLFPNPATASVNILVEAPQKDNITMVVVDAVGRVVKSQRQSVETGTNGVQLNVNSLAQGSYFIKVSCDSNCETVVTRFVKE